MQQGEERSAVRHTGNQQQGPAEQAEGHPRQSHQPHRSRQSKSGPALPGMGRDLGDFPDQLQAIPMHHGRSEAHRQRHRPDNVMSFHRSFGQKSRIRGEAVRHSGWGERREHPPLEAREGDAHGVEVVVTKRHGSREPLGGWMVRLVRLIGFIGLRWLVIVRARDAEHDFVVNRPAPKVLTSCFGREQRKLTVGGEHF